MVTGGLGSRAAPKPLPLGCEARCPGCHHRQLTAQQSEARKAQFVAAKLAPWRDCLAPIRGVADQARWHYRERVCLAAAWEGGRWRLGLKDRQQNVVDIPHCPVHGPRVGRALGLLVPRLPPAADFPLAFWVQSGAQLTLVVKAKPPLATAWFDAALGEALGGVGIEGLWLHGNPSAGAQLFTKRGWQHLWGRGWSTTAQGLRHGPAAFQQLVSQLYEAALDEAEAFLAPAARDGIVDLYCGVGASVVRWQRRGGRVLGVELDGNAVACARVNAPAAEILRGGCAQRLPQLRTWLEAGTFEERLGYLNPPRTGLEPAVTAWLASHRPLARLAYLSCSPNTLARDLGLLEAGGYRVVRLVPWDFFPHTRHVETLALLARVEPDPP